MSSIPQKIADPIDLEVAGSQENRRPSWPVRLFLNYGKIAGAVPIRIDTVTFSLFSATSTLKRVNRPPALSDFFTGT